MRIGYIAPVCCALFLFPISTATAAEVSVKQTKELKGAIAVSPDFSQYAERIEKAHPNYDYGVKIKEVTSGKELKKLEWDKDWGKPQRASFSSDGKKLAIFALRYDGATSAKVFDLASGEMKLNVRHSLLEFVAFTPDSKRLASAGGPGASEPAQTLWIWDIETRKKIVTESPAKPECLAFSPDGKLVVAAPGKYGNEPLLVFCESATGKIIATIGKEEKEDEYVVDVAVSPNGKLVALATRRPSAADGIIKLFDAGTGKKIATFDDIQEQIGGVAFHPRLNLLGATGNDKTIRFWDLGSEKLVSTTRLPKRDLYLRLQFSTDGTQCATCTTIGDTITLWNVEVKK
jgi:WD40 repeat protein